MAVRKKRKRHFSIVYVPDQERDPKSVSMSYAEGRLFLILFILIGLHILFGFYGYYRIHKLNRLTANLETKNSELILQNKKIDKIARDFYEIRITDEKIRKAFGGSLGLDEASMDALDDIPLDIQHSTSRQTSDYRTPVPRSAKESGSLYRLLEKESEYFNPEYMPTLLPVEGYLTAHFKKSGWFEGQSHFGIDIAATKGSPIRAAGTGHVLFADWTPDFGNVVVISHGNGLFTYYAHAMRLIVDQGFKVRRGQTIALLGSSGYSSAPHLHFEMWKDGEPLDPELYISALQRQEAETGS